jgi:PAS domain S-box-containing protein
MLLEDVLPKSDSVDDYEIEHNFESIGRKTMLLNACKIIEKENTPPIILLAIEDITERKRLEYLLEESEERYRRIFETASDGIVLLEKLEGTITQANPAAEKMLGYPVNECIGKKLQDIGVAIDTSDFPAIMRVLDRSGIINYAGVPVETKSGQHIYTEIYMVDRARTAQCNIRDITERKKLEEQLRQSQKMEAIGQLASGVAHDFNNILTTIMGYGSLALSGMAKDDPQRVNIEHMLEGSEKAAYLTNDLLLFSRKQTGERNCVDLNEIMKKMATFLRRIIGEDILCKTVLPPEPIPVLADAHHLEQVMMNLATNAKDAMPGGGIFSVTTEPIMFDKEFITTHGYGQPGKYALITVSDTGKGMDETTRQRIFEPFFTTKEMGQGTGLGMAVVYGIVKGHDGYINVYSEPGLGTTFRIYLPIYLPITTVEGEEMSETIHPISLGKGETILIAEDDPQVREVVRLCLEDYGYIIIDAENGEEAVKQYRDNMEMISLVLLDVIMPIKNGRETCNEIKSLNPDAKVMFMSGYTDDIITTKGMLDAGTEFVSKPVTPYRLLRKVREVLDR